MANKDKTPETIPEFTLEDIMREFGSGSPDSEGASESGISLETTQVFTPVTAAEASPAEDKSSKETTPIAEESSPDEEFSAGEAPIEEESSVEETATAEEEHSGEEEAPTNHLDETQVFTPITIEDLLAEPEAPAEEVSAGEEDIPAGSGSSAEEEVPTAEAPAEEEETPAAGESSEDGQAPAEDEEASTVEASGEESPEEAEPSAREEVFTQEQIPAPKAIPFRSRLGDLKRKLVAGPEKRYYDLTEIGVGRVQLAIFLNLLIVVLCTGGTALYAMGAVAENRLRLMIFSQILAMMISALLGCYLLMDGILDLFTGKFSLNTMLFLTLAACAADAVFCLRELRVPCCAAFSLEMTFALWNRSLRRSTEMGQMDTLRKANRLDALVKVKGYFGNGDGIVRTEGRVEDFMDNYSARTTPEKALNIYALLSVLACVGISVLAGMRHDLSLAVQVFSTSMLVAVPVGAFVSQSRPASILERRLHMVGTVICGWQGVKTLCGKASFPLTDRDIFPLGSVKLNGVKFVGDIDPDSAIAAAAALMRANGGSLESVFTQLLKSRNGLVYPADEVQILHNGVSALVRGRSCLLGLQECMEAQGIQIPENARVEQAVYFAMGGQLAAVFALNYNRTKSSAGGLVTLGSCRRIRPMVLADNFTITAQLLQDKFGIKPKRYDFPDRELRRELASSQPDPELIAGALSTQQHLASAAYAVSGAKSLRTASRVGMALHIFAGVVGLLVMAALAYLGDMQLLSPFNVLLYQLVWLVPGLLITEWTRTV